MVSASNTTLCMAELQAYLELDLGLSNVLLAAIAVGNLLSLRNLVPHSLSTVSRGSTRMPLQCSPRR